MKEINYKILVDPIQLLAFGFGSGLSPIVPGTCGTLVGVLFYLIIHGLSLWFYILITLFLTLIGIWICDVSEKAIGIPDYPGIVWDEVAGFLWVMIAVPFHWWTLLLGFILFRLFDMIKPWPIRWFDQKVKGGFGVMLDDVIAAIFAWIVLQCIVFFV